MTDMSREVRELAEIFSGEEKPLHPDTVHITLGGKKDISKKETTTQKPDHRNGKWEPVKPAPNGMDRLIDCVKWTVVFGALCLLVFYWQQSGQMADSAAVPSMCACCGLAGLGVGKSMMGGRS